MSDLLTTYMEQRSAAIAKSEDIVRTAQAAERDLTEAEQTILRENSQIVDKITEKIDPLYELHRQAQRNAEVQRTLSETEAAELRAVDGTDGEFLRSFNSPAEFIAKRNRAIDSRDQKAIQKFDRVLAHEKTANVPGLLPRPIVGPIIDWIDARRPVLGSFRQLQMPASGTSFDRPRVTQHTKAGIQSAEKTDLASQELVIGLLPVSRITVGGTLNVSAQVVDLTSPEALQVIIDDMATQVALQGEEYFFGLVHTEAKRQKETFTISTAAPKDLLKALAQASVKIYNGMGGGALADRIIVSPDVWAALISMTDNGRPVINPGGYGQQNGVGASDGIGSFGFELAGVPGVVSAAAPANTFIVGSSVAAESYTSGGTNLLQASEPTILGLQLGLYQYIAGLIVEPKGLAVLAP